MDAQCVRVHEPGVCKCAFATLGLAHAHSHTTHRHHDQRVAVQVAGKRFVDELDADDLGAVLEEGGDDCPHVGPRGQPLGIRVERLVGGRKRVGDLNEDSSRDFLQNNIRVLLCISFWLKYS